MKTGSADKDRALQALKLTLAGVIGQVGCLTLVIIGIALSAGLWLDNQFQTRPIITLALVIASVPLTIFLMFRVVLSLAPKIQLTAEPSVGASDETTEEEPEGGTGRGNSSEA
jgi:hypothetical protein